jgi:hypothetical protein
MNRQFFALAVVAAGLAGCATDYVPPPPSTEPGPAWTREVQEGRPGLFGDLRWNVDLTGKYEAVKASDEEEFKKWRALENNPERREFEEWRAWQEWKRKNPK